MAATESSSVFSSLSLLNNFDHNVNVGCELCYYRESQLKEVLEDLISAKVIIDILQKELLATKVVSTLCTDQLASSKEPNNEVTADVRSFSANKTSFGIHCQGYTPSRSSVLSTSTNHIPTIHNLKEAQTYHYEYPEVNTPPVSLNPQATKTPRVKGNKIDTIINGATNSSDIPQVQYSTQMFTTIIKPGLTIHRSLRRPKIVTRALKK